MMAWSWTILVGRVRTRLALPGTERNNIYRCHLLRASYVPGIFLSLWHIRMHVPLIKTLSTYSTPFYR